MRNVRTLTCRVLLYVALVLGITGAPAAQETLWTPEDAQALQTAQASLVAGSARSALTTLDDLLLRYPNSVDLHRLRGLSLVALDRNEEARAALSIALSRGAFSADVLSALLQIDFAAERVPALLSSSRLLLLLEPDNSEWALLHADLPLQNGQSAAAEVVYTALLDRDAVSPTLFERLARTAYADGRGEEAASLFETAYYMGSEDESVPEVLELLWLELGDGERSRLWAERRGGATERGKDLRAARRSWAGGDSEGALAIARTLEADGPEEDRAQAAALQGRIERQRGNVNESLAHFQRALDLGLEDADVLALVGSSAYNDGRLDEAIVLLGRAWNAGRRDASILPFLVQAAVDTEQNEVADRFLVEYLEQNGMDETARRLIQRRAR